MPVVLITPTVLRGRSGPYQQMLTEAGFRLVYPRDDEDTMDLAVLARYLAEADAMLASTEQMTREVLAASKLRVVARMGVGYDSVDVAAAAELNIAVAITPGALETSVAEHTIAMLLGVTRDLVARDRLVREGKWVRDPWPRMAGKTLGLIGLGRIGKAVVPRAQGLAMKVVAYDPAPDHRFALDHHVGLLSLDELLATADVVSLHLPCTPQTTGLINAASLGKMKRGAILLNTSRGPLVDEPALCEALRSGRLLAAGIDVFCQEPPPLENPLMTAPNVLLCPHMGGLDDDSVQDMASLSAKSIIQLHQGKWPEGYIVNRELKGRFHW